ncbi:DNA replication complex GINS protein psf2 [Neolecta irregularis DAH-3]|uniref:DNA replication complex GINS protein PSF2 n=1 Tax=Neolecta irregularis (strain DAH-3) TaxID=1198029 RepID=A0A1U7LVV8_NEOID|nr:DNA replication complex GINS protein psf2 [Neolecta irregularis DAH-3]|eukprot:OLL26682.1 DNA replication complex GINS protein psf2 [Neolecta irregularis DAH-3]
MALPPQYRGVFTPQELSFSAENIKVQIVPRRAMNSIPLISGTIPQLRPPRRAEVPLWIAILLKQQRCANIVSPDWLSVDALKEKLDEETVPGAAFSALPFQWLEISEAILETASDDVEDADTVRRLLRDLREARQAKAREGLTGLNESHLQMDNLGWMEINEIRFVSRAMDQLRRIKAVKQDQEKASEDEMDASNGNDSD